MTKKDVKGTPKMLSENDFLLAYRTLPKSDQVLITMVRELEAKRSSSKFPDGGWVPAMDLGGSHGNPRIMKQLVSLHERGFLESSDGVAGRFSFNGRRFKVPAHIKKV